MDFWSTIQLLKNEQTYRIPDWPSTPSRTLSENWHMEARNLPSLTKESVPEWWKVAEPYLEYRYGYNIQDHMLFSESSNKVQYNEGTASGGVGRRTPGYIRGDIRKAIRQSLETIAAQGK